MKRCLQGGNREGYPVSLQWFSEDMSIGVTLDPIGSDTSKVSIDADGY